MYRLHDTLIFPALKRIADEDALVGEGLPLYRLDWSNNDSHQEGAHRRWTQQVRNTYDVPFHSLVNALWRARLDAYVFAIADGYADEIARMSRMAQMEWSHPRHFDTVIRETCLQVAVAYVRTAFALLADCLWDREAKEGAGYWFRGGYKHIAQSAMQTRFWDWQTGDGVVKHHSDLTEILSDQYRWTDEELEYRNSFIEGFNEQATLREEACRKLRTWTEEGEEPEAEEPEEVGHSQVPRG